MHTNRYSKRILKVGGDEEETYIVEVITLFQ